MTGLFRYNLLLAVGWCAVVGQFTFIDLLVGYAIGGLVLSITSPMFEHLRYLRRLWDIARLAAYFIRVFTVSCAIVTRDVLTPGHDARPAIVAIPLSVTTTFQIVTLANLISLTPGSLNLDLSPDHKTLYMHVMFVDDPDEIRRQIKSGLERRLMEATG